MKKKSFESIVTMILVLQLVQVLSLTSNPSNNLELACSFGISQPELTTLWEIPADSFSVGSPVRVLDGSVAFTTERSLTLVDPSRGVVVWKAILDEKPAWQTAVASKHLLCFYANGISAHNLTNGKLAWKKQFEQAITAHPCAGDGKVVLALSKTIACLDAATGNQIWSTLQNGIVTQKPCIVDGVVYASTANGFIAGFDLRDGAIEWESNTGDSATCMLVGTAKFLFLVSEKTLYAFDRKAGKPIWKFLAKSDGFAPSEQNGKVIFPSRDKTVYCIDANTASKGCCMAIGKQLWSLYMSLECNSQPVVAGNSFLLPTAEGTLHAISIDEGNVTIRMKTGFDLSKALILQNQIISQHGKKLASIAQLPDSVKLYADRAVLSRNGLNIAIDAGARVISGKSMIPARYVIEPFGGSVSWDSEDGSVTCVYSNRKLVMNIGVPYAVIDNKTLSMDGQKPVIVSGRAYVPARFLAEKFMGLTLTWNAKERSFELLKRGSK